MKYVLSLGGSLIVPAEIDVPFIKAFKKLIAEEVDKGHSFVVVSGGGRTARTYQSAASELSCSDEDKDWVGIGATRINAQLLRAVFSERSKVVENPTLKIRSGSRIIIASGWKPGFSSDMVAVLLAKNIKAGVVVNLTNVDYVYDKDPKIAGAVPLKNISWAVFRKIVGSEWKPGMNAPFDPIAAKLAEKLGLKVVVMNGKNLGGLKSFIEGKDFAGTVIE